MLSEYPSLPNTFLSTGCPRMIVRYPPFPTATPNCEANQLATGCMDASSATTRTPASTTNRPGFSVTDTGSGIRCIGWAAAQILTKNKVRRGMSFITTFYNEVMNLGIMNDPEKFITVKSAERDLLRPDHDAFTPYAADLVHHHDKRLMHPHIPACREPLLNRLHAHLRYDRPSAASQVDLYIVTQSLYI